MYAAALERMEMRGIDNPFVLHGYAIFLAVTQEDDFMVIEDYAHRASLMERKRKERVRQDLRVNNSSHIYNLSYIGFYRHAAFSQQTGDSWHNYALCRMLVFRDMPGARDAFLRALKLSPSNENQKIVNNFNILLQNSEYMGTERQQPWDAFDELRIRERQCAM